MVTSYWSLFVYFSNNLNLNPVEQVQLMVYELQDVKNIKQI